MRFAPAVLALVLLTGALAAQGAPPPGVVPNGPVIKSGGASALVERPSFQAPANHEFKIVWEINVGNEKDQNAQLGTLARFYNLHVRHGVPLERLHAAAVVHGTGWISLLNDSAYAARYGGGTNPSKALVEELLAAGAQLVVCGQTAAFRGLKQEELMPGVKMGISAMTALSTFYAQGYNLQPWR